MFFCWPGCWSAGGVGSENADTCGTGDRRCERDTREPDAQPAAPPGPPRSLAAFYSRDHVPRELSHANLGSAAGQGQFLRSGSEAASQPSEVAF